MSSSTSTAAGSSVVPDVCTGQAATQAAWRFFNNERITHKDDVGYGLTTSLLIDGANGNPIAPMQVIVRTANATRSSGLTPLACNAKEMC